MSEQKKTPAKKEAPKECEVLKTIRTKDGVLVKKGGKVKLSKTEHAYFKKLKAV